MITPREREVIFRRLAALEKRVAELERIVAKTDEAWLTRNPEPKGKKP